MTLIEELEQLQAKSPKPRCAVGRFLDTLEQYEQDSFIVALKNGTFSGNVIATVISKRLGEKVTNSVVYKHKSGTCSC